MSIVPNSPIAVNADKAPYDCLLYDPIDKRAHFKSRLYAEDFNAKHMDWRVSHENADVPLPAAYEQLSDGVYCDPVNKRACFADLQSAWLFYQIHTDYSVEWLDSVYRDVNDMFHFGSVIDGLRSLGLGASHD